MRQAVRKGATRGGVALALCALASAQSGAGAESRFTLAHEVVALGSSGAGATLSAAATLGQVAVGAEASSESYVLHAGVAWTVPEVPGTAPIVFGAREGSASVAGGDLVDVYGYNFLAPGAGPLDVRFGGAPGVGTAVLSNTHATTTTPPQPPPPAGPVNPLPDAELRVANAHGEDGAEHSELQSSFLFEPALVNASHPIVGRPLYMRVFTEPGATLVLVLGQAAPPAYLVVPPLGGAVEVIFNQQYAVPLQFLSGDQYRHVVSVPDDLALVGKKLSYQALSLTAFPSLIGAFSNALTFTFHP